MRISRPCPSIVLAAFLAAYLVYQGGFLKFAAHRKYIRSQATHQTIYTVPGTFSYRLLGVVYTPTLYLMHAKINFDPHAAQ